MEIIHKLKMVNCDEYLKIMKDNKIDTTTSKMRSFLYNDTVKHNIIIRFYETHNLFEMLNSNDIKKDLVMWWANYDCTKCNNPLDNPMRTYNTIPYIK